MICKARAAAFALVVLGRSLAQTSVSTCEELRDAVQSCSSGIITISGDFSTGCTDNIAIREDQVVEVNGSGHQIPLSTSLANSSESSLFSNSGSLVLRDIVFTDEDAAVDELAARVVRNEGALEVDGCTFDSIGLRYSDFRLSYGGAVSDPGCP